MNNLNTTENKFIQISRMVFLVLEKTSMTTPREKHLVIRDFENNCKNLLSAERYPAAILGARLFIEALRGNMTTERLAIQGYLLSKLLTYESEKENFGEVTPLYTQKNSQKIIQMMKQMIF